MVKYLANILTFSRIIGSIWLLFFPAFSVGFYVLYLFCGFSDMIDGTIARLTNSTSKFGSRLDTVADIAFIAASMCKLLPVMRITGWLWIWGGVIAVIKIGNIICGYVSQRQFIAVHSVMNKMAGLLLFLMPLTISFTGWKYPAMAVCAVATVSAIQESLIIIGDMYDKS